MINSLIHITQCGRFCYYQTKTCSSISQNYWDDNDKMQFFSPLPLLGKFSEMNYYLCNYMKNKRSISKSKTFPFHHPREMKNSFVPSLALVCFSWSHWEWGYRGLNWHFLQSSQNFQQSSGATKCHISMLASLLILKSICMTNE